jgi:hypothetical protein
MQIMKQTLRYLVLSLDLKLKNSFETLTPIQCFIDFKEKLCFGWSYVVKYRQPLPHHLPLQPAVKARGRELVEQSRSLIQYTKEVSHSDRQFFFLHLLPYFMHCES